MFTDLNTAFRLLASAKPANSTEVIAMRRHFERIPEEYLQLVSEVTELEVQHSSGQYLRIWGLDGCVEMDEAYKITEFIPDAIPIGDDGGGHFLFYHTGDHGLGLYHVGYGNLDADDAIWVSETLADLLIRGKGIESF